MANAFPVGPARHVEEAHIVAIEQVPSGAAATRPRLAEMLGGPALAKLPASGTWRPLPPLSDRAAWEVDAASTSAVVKRAEDLSSGEWPVLPAAQWLAFLRSGNRSGYEARYFGRRHRISAALQAACITGDPRWIDDVLDGVWLVCEETSWSVPAHDRFAHDGPGLPDPARSFVDLFAAETAALLAWVHEVLGDELAARAPGSVQRLRDEVEQRVLVPFRTTDWHWSGRVAGHPVNNWNPWIHSNVLACALLVEDDQEGLRTTVQRVLEGLDVFLDSYADDGGCDEGQSYWWRAGASLFDCLELLLQSSGGALDGFELPLVREIGRYPHRIHIDGTWYVNVADGSARSDGANEPHLLYAFGRRVGDEEMRAHARAMRGDGPAMSVGGVLSAMRQLRALTDRQWAAEPARPAPLVGDAWWPQTELWVARERAGEAAGLFVAVKGGHNAECHNHNDVGSVLVALDGRPALVDVGVGEYTRATFGPDRYRIWTMRSSYHNVPEVDGVEQTPGRDRTARDVVHTAEGAASAVRLDLADAYPAEAGIGSWLREVTLDRPGAQITMAESWRLDHDPESVVVHLMCAGPADTTTAGRIVVQPPEAARALVLGYDPDALGVTVEPITVDDGRLTPVWGPVLYRATLAVRRPARDGSWRLTMSAGDAG